MIILQNSKTCNATVANLDKEGYIRLVELIVSDYRITKTYGKDTIAQRKGEWLAEVK